MNLFQIYGTRIKRNKFNSNQIILNSKKIQNYSFCSKSEKYLKFTF